jgi:hypothetical protein
VSGWPFSHAYESVESWADGEGQSTDITSVRGREDHTRSGWDAFDQREYAEAESVLAVHPEDFGALDLKQAAHWRRGDIAATVGAYRRMRVVRDSAGLALR